MSRISKFFLSVALLAAALLGPLRPAFAGSAADRVVSAKTAQAVPTTDVFDTSDWQRFSAQLTYLDGTPGPFVSSDGAKSTWQLNILSTTNLFGTSIQIGTNTFTWGTQISTGPGIGITTVMMSTRAAAAFTSVLGGAFNFTTTTVNGLGVVAATRTAVQADFVPLVSGSTNAVFSSPFAVGGIDPSINVTSDIITYPNHGLTTGLALYVSTTSGTMPGGLTFGATVYAIAIDLNQFALATTTTNAVAGTRIDITSLTGSSVIKFNPIALSLAAGTGWKWQCSNDGVNYIDVPATSSVTYSAAGSSIWDFQFFNYRLLKAKYTAPTTGGLSFTIRVSGKLN